MAKLNRIKAVLAEQDKTSKWCSNSIQPDLQTLDRISKLLDVNIKDLLVDNKE